MFLNKISAINFKNYKQIECSFSENINCFVGNNGSGKTNLLDAIHYLSMCRSFLNPIDTQNIHFDEHFFVIQGSWSNEQANAQNKTEIYCGVKKGAKKIFKKNKIQYDKLAEHIGQYPSVMISPYDQNLITEGSEVRRRWADGIISQFNRQYLDDLIMYLKVIDQRNALLKNMSLAGFFNYENIEVWDDQLVKYGNRIFEIRKAFLQDFIPIFQKYHQSLTRDVESVSIQYKSQLLEGDFKLLLDQAQRQDFQKQYSTTGIHKDDLVFEINGYPIKKFGSQGQQKSMLIALKLAQFEWLHLNLGKKPILLLDDIFDKLDNDRVSYLMSLVSNHQFGQVMVTDTDGSRVEAIFNSINQPFSLFNVAKNEISIQSN